ncbi:MAG: 3-hydroxyacyl-ACP dehydratase FabZ [Dethiosulfatibacter sp.]|nr:3-hydroxyacyl-ACP dehydratase FabZ [Dethiosulfatibacter sp.]
MFNSNEIEKVIPHRYPFLFIDRIVSFDPGVKAVAIKDVSANEPFFLGHFPGNHVMPGVIIVEAMAQTGAFALLSLEANKGKTAYFGGIKKMRFRKKVLPGDTLRLETTIIKLKGSLGIGHAIAYVNDLVVAEGELTFAIG